MPQSNTDARCPSGEAMTVKLLPLAEVARRIKRSKPILQEWIKEGRFPKGIVDASGALCWPENLVEAWQTLLLAGFFEWPVKSKRGGKDRKRMETIANEQNPKKADPKT
jgi:predicted DNA-binding transcriptional regulator AlpA